MSRLTQARAAVRDRQRHARRALVVSLPDHGRRARARGTLSGKQPVCRPAAGAPRPVRQLHEREARTQRIGRHYPRLRAARVLASRPQPPRAGPPGPGHRSAALALHLRTSRQRQNSHLASYPQPVHRRHGHPARPVGRWPDHSGIRSREPSADREDTGTGELTRPRNDRGPTVGPLPPPACHRGGRANTRSVGAEPQRRHRILSSPGTGARQWRGALDR